MRAVSRRSLRVIAALPSLDAARDLIALTLAAAVVLLFVDSLYRQRR